MNDLMKFNDTYWVEKRKDFVKLCFAFTPEFDEDLKQLDFLYAKISSKIILDYYKIYCVNRENKDWSIIFKNIFEIDGFIQILIPKTQETKIDKMKQLLDENRCKVNQIHNSFYSSSLSNMQKAWKGSIIISNSNLNRCREFSACPINIDPYNLAVYSVDIYGEGVEDINWGIN